MLRRKEWGVVTRASMLIGSLSAAAFVFSATATMTAAQPSAPAAGSLASQIGKPIKPFAKLHANAKLRTPDQIQAFQAAHPSLGLRRPAHRPLTPMGDKAYREAKRQAAMAPFAAKPGAQYNAPPPVAPTKVVMKAYGPKQSDSGNGYYPPDSNGAIGDTQLVAPVNLSWNVYNRSGTLLLHTTFNALLGTSDALSDPRVLYDPVWRRWVFAIITIPTSSSDTGAFWLGISTTSDATGSFWLYRVNAFGNGGIWDYDELGMTQDAVLITGNHFEWNGTYDGAVAAAIPKAALYNGLGWGAPLFGTPPASGTLTPPIVQGSNANAYFIASNTPNGTLDIYRGNNMSNQSQATYTLQAQIPASGLAVPRHANQPGTTDQLDTLDGRFQSPSAQYTGSSGDTMLWNAKTGGVGSFPGVWYYQIDADTNAIVHANTAFNTATSDDFNPSIAATLSAASGQDEAFLTWSSTDAPNNTNAKILFSGMQASDGGPHLVGKQLFGSAAALTGNYDSNFGAERWGDYSSVFLDSKVVTNCGVANRRAAIFNERIKDANTWQVNFGIVGFC